MGRGKRIKWLCCATFTPQKCMPWYRSWTSSLAIMCCRIHRILLQLSTMASQQSHCILSQAGLHGWLAHIHTSSTPVHTNDCTTALPWGSGGCELSDDAFKYKRMYYLSPTLLIKCHLN